MTAERGSTQSKILYPRLRRHCLRIRRGLVTPDLRGPAAQSSWSRQIAAAEVDQRRRAGAIESVDRLTDRDDDAVALDRLHEAAVDRPHRIEQDRRTGLQGSPATALETRSALLRSFAAEHVGDVGGLSR